MPADLTAAQLIALLRKHPLTCGALWIYHTKQRPKLDDNDVWCADGLSLDDDFGDEALDCFRRWLTGALVEAHVERGIGMPVDLMGWVTHGDRMKPTPAVWTYHPTILHALLAGMGSHLKETT